MRYDESLWHRFAADTLVDCSMTDRDAMIMTDSYGTCILLEATRKFDLEP